MLAREGHLAGMRLSKEEHDLFVDKPLAVAIFIFNFLPKAIEEFDVCDGRFFPDLASGGLDFILTSFNLALWEIPVAGCIIQQQVFRFSCAFEIKDYCTSGPFI